MTDGNVIITIPTGFKCEVFRYDSLEDVSDLFELTCGDESIWYIASGYDTDKSSKNFDTYWKSGKESFFADFTLTPRSEGVMKISGNDCLYKIVQYENDENLGYWGFYSLYDDNTGKLLVASCAEADTATVSINEFLRSVRFQ